MVKNSPAMQETQVQSLGGDTLEKEMATYSRILAWKIPQTEDPRGLQSLGRKESDPAEHTQCRGSLECGHGDMTPSTEKFVST